MLIPKVKAKEFEKFGFKKCKGEYGKNDCYYLCIAKGEKMLFVSNVCFDVNDWKSDRNNLVEEMADVIICLENLKQIFAVTNTDIEEWVNFKQERVVKRMNTEKG